MPSTHSSYIGYNGLLVDLQYSTSLVALFHYSPWLVDLSSTTPTPTIYTYTYTDTYKYARLSIELRPLYMSQNRNLARVSVGTVSWNRELEL